MLVAITVSDIVGRLLTTGLIAEGAEGPSRGGRRPTLIVFQDDAHVILGVDMGASHVSVALTDLRGGVLAWRNEEHPVQTDPEGTRKLIEALIRQDPSIAPMSAVFDLAESLVALLDELLGEGSDTPPGDGSFGLLPIPAEPETC